MPVKIIKSHPESNEAKELIRELSELLLEITGDDGKSSFSNGDMDSPRSTFIVAQVKGENLACGSIRPLTKYTCEIKRMYSKKTKVGLGRQVLNELEKQAKEFGYKEICLSTRKVNKNAVNFYLANGYSPCESYGKYKDLSESICLSKIFQTR